ncbi:MAG: hypothetical protein JRN41_03070 [Nitrososphaerota archaeon]|nr:hypothetical protein [Nitrososphaerota archaeon]
MEHPHNPEGSIGRSSPPGSSQRPERNLTLLFISTAVLLAFVGSTIGTLFLGQLAGLPIESGAGLFPSHPYLQIYGFIALFVMGVDYSLLPRFKVGRLPAVFFGYLAYALITGANVSFLLYSILPSGSFPYIEGGALFMFLGSLIFLSQVLLLVVRPTGGFPEANPPIVLSSISLELISLFLLIDSAGHPLLGGVFSPQMIYLALVGFAGSMIYAVEIRSVSFRQCNYRKQVANLCWVLQGLGIASIYAGVMMGSALVSTLGAVLLVGAALSEMVSIKILELAHPLMYRPAMTKMHFRIMRYNEVCILLASGWLIFGSAMGLVWLGTGTTSFLVKDSFIHAVAIGFVGSTTTCFAPMLLPGLLGHKGPVTGLSFGPIITLNVGILVRVAGDFQTLTQSSLPLWESASGPLVLLAMGWLLVMLWRIGRPAQVTAQKRAPETFSLARTRGIGEGKITVVTRKTMKEITLSIWFVVRDDKIYLLPVRGSATNWYRNILKNNRIRIDISDHLYDGRV